MVQTFSSFPINCMQQHYILKILCKWLVMHERLDQVSGRPRRGENRDNEAEKAECLQPNPCAGEFQNLCLSYVHLNWEIYGEWPE